MGMATYLEKAWLNTIRNQDFNGINNIYVGLFTTPGTDISPGTEPSDSAYARQLITFDAPEQQDGKSVIKNNNEISYSIATKSWGVVTNFGLFDSATGGNYLFHGEVKIPKNVEVDDQIKIQPNELIVSLE